VEQAVEQAPEQAARLRYLNPPLDQSQALRQWFLELLKEELAEQAEQAEQAKEAEDQAEQAEEAVEQAEQQAEQAADQAEQLVRGAREWALRRVWRTCLQKRAPYMVNPDIRECDGRLDRLPPTPNQMCRDCPFVVASAPIEVSMGHPQRQHGTDRHQVGPMQSPPSRGRHRPCRVAR
jgi:hypothetical protein